MKILKNLLFAAICITYIAVTTTPEKYTDIKKEVGNHRLSTLNPEQIKWILNILNNLNEIERHHFFISFNHHYDMTNEFRQKTTVKINLSKLQYHDSSRISKEDIDHIIRQAHKHALSY